MPSWEWKKFPRAVVTFGLDSRENGFLQSYYTWKGIPIESYPNSLLPKSSQLSEVTIFWQDPHDGLLDWCKKEGWFTVAIGKPYPDLTKKLIENGIACFWTDTLNIHQIPVYFPESHPSSLLACIYTGIPRLDGFLLAFLESIGIRSILAMDPNHIFPILSNHKPDFLILHWENLEKQRPGFLQEWGGSTRKSIPMPILGLFDFSKENISTEILRYTSQITKMNLTPTQLISGLVYGLRNLFPLGSHSTKNSSHMDVHALQFVFPERKRLQSMEWNWVPSPPHPERNLEYQFFWKWYEWLLDQDLWNPLFQ